MKKQVSLDAPSTKRDLDDAVAQITFAVAKTIEESEKKLTSRIEESEKKLSNKIEDVRSDISEHRRRIRDLETDTVTRRELTEFKTKVLPQ